MRSHHYSKYKLGERERYYNVLWRITFYSSVYKIMRMVRIKLYWRSDVTRRFMPIYIFHTRTCDRATREYWRENAQSTTNYYIRITTITLLYNIYVCILQYTQRIIHIIITCKVGADGTVTVGGRGEGRAIYIFCKGCSRERAQLYGTRRRDACVLHGRCSSLIITWLHTKMPLVTYSDN